MAFLRRGLVTNKGAIPSVHTQHNVNAFLHIVSNEKPTEVIEAQPILTIRKVEKILYMANTVNEYHIVKLVCGHTVKSKSTFQGYCKQCKVFHD